jgi:transposase
MQEHAKSYSTDLSDTKWDMIKNMIPNEHKRGRPLDHSRRLIVNAILYIVRAGCAWRLLPKDFAPWQTAYGYYRKLRKAGIWKLIHDQLRIAVRRKVGKKPSPTAAILDSQSVKIADQAGASLKGVFPCAMRRATCAFTTGRLLALAVESSGLRSNQAELLEPVLSLRSTPE